MAKVHDDGKPYHFSRKFIWIFGKRPVPWGAFTDWNSWVFGCGEVVPKRNGETVPEWRWGVSFQFRSWHFIVFKNGEKFIWLGDRQWKMNNH